MDPIAPKKEDEEQLSENWKIKMLYDGECPLCMREVSSIISVGVGSVLVFVYEMGLMWGCLFLCH